MMMKWIISILTMSIMPVLTYSSSIFRFHSEDIELCYGNLYFDRIYNNVVNIKYIPEHIPYRYNFINRTFSVDELDDNVFFTHGYFLKHKYGCSLNPSLIVSLSGNLKYNDIQCSVNVSCLIKNLTTSTSTILTSKHKTYSLYRSMCIAIIGYDSIIWYKYINDRYNDIYDFTAICMLIASTLIVIIYVFKKIKMNS
ncbi:Type-I membrane glycoprotein [Monkeypox virus]|nr:Type-I membrane glycoprotein [Monkeypox virus]UWO30630.1 Type-I membrane glycoprotein [Monkeypox virus]UWO30809.1 Type-I membrane glycoprotein [Monkeypox virus]UWO30988.1 Type-I membrane glycoprotein [Monkeypox virus]UWO34744.1 Type-I membrane glycoprotein [Monkeypox virus]